MKQGRHVLLALGHMRHVSTQWLMITRFSKQISRTVLRVHSTTVQRYMYLFIYLLFKVQ